MRVVLDIYLLILFLLSASYLLSDPDHRTPAAYLAAALFLIGVGAGVLSRRGLWNFSD